MLDNRCLLMHEDTPVCVFEYSKINIGDSPLFSIKKFESILKSEELERQLMPGGTVERNNIELERRKVQTIHQELDNNIPVQPDKENQTEKKTNHIPVNQPKHRIYPESTCSLEKFILGRGIPTEKRQIEKFQNNFRFSNLEENDLVQAIGYARLPTDKFWIKSENSPVTWADINPLNPNSGIHKYQETFVNAPLLQETLYRYGGGSLQSWVYDLEKNEYLFIKSSDNQKIRNKEFIPLFEVIASQIGKELGFGRDIVDYYLIKDYKSCSKSFIKPDEELVSIKYIKEKMLDEEKIRYENGQKDYKLLNQKDGVYEETKQILKYAGIEEKRIDEYLNKMLLLDALIGNSDRQLDNLSLIKDSKTGKFKDIAPIYDLGNSFGINVDMFSNTTPQKFLYLLKDNHRVLESNSIVRPERETLPKFSFHPDQTFYEMLKEGIDKNPNIKFDSRKEKKILNIIESCFDGYEKYMKKNPNIQRELEEENPIKQIKAMKKEMENYVKESYDICRNIQKELRMEHKEEVKRDRKEPEFFE